MNWITVRGSALLASHEARRGCPAADRSEHLRRFGLHHHLRTWHWKDARKAQSCLREQRADLGRIAALCGTARTTDHNLVFLKSLEAALHADPAWDGERFRAVPERGLRTFARIYASWAASQAFYRERLYRELGYVDLEDYLQRAWEPSYRRRHAADLLAMLRIWMSNDVSAARHAGNLPSALG